jgi:hypothetical protein
MYIGRVLIRCFLHVQPLANSTFWMDLGALYLRQLVKAEFDVCAVTLGAACDIREAPIIQDYPKLFLSRAPGEYVSLVIGWGDDYKIRCCDAKKNICLTAMRPRPLTTDKLEELRKFDFVLVPTPDEKEHFRWLGFDTRLLTPNVADLKWFFQQEIFPKCR